MRRRLREFASFVFTFGTAVGVVWLFAWIENPRLSSGTVWFFAEIAGMTVAWRDR